MISSGLRQSRRSFLRSVILFGMGLKFMGASKLVDLKERLSLINRVSIHEESTEGGVIDCNCDRKGRVKKLEITQCWESGRYFLRILTDDERIISAEEVVEHYNVPFYVTKEFAEDIGSEEYFDHRKSHITRGRFVFKNNKIVRSIDNPITEYEDRVLASLEKSSAKRVRQALESLGKV